MKNQIECNKHEITLRAILLAIILPAILAASNIYLALKLGHTIAASIPAAVISMTILRFFPKSSVLESNLIQTAASAGEGVAAALSFILPALIIIHFWPHFYYWQTVGLVIIGGMLGLLFSIPLRNILLTRADLSFPEGTAIGQIMKVNFNNKLLFKQLVLGDCLGSIISALQTGFKVIADSWQLWLIRKKILFGFSLGFSPALLAAGFIIGMQACVGILIGLITCWLVGVPLLSLVYDVPTQIPAQMVMQLWNEHIRFIGVGTMLLGGLWTIAVIIKPIIKGLKISLQSNLTWRSKDFNDRYNAQNQDLPHYLILIGIPFFGLLCGMLYWHIFKLQYPAASMFHGIIPLFGVIFTLVSGFFLASICAYLSGLVGMTNNPLSGLMLIAIVMLGFLISVATLHIYSSNEEVAFVILVTTMIAIITAISGENIQDLKAGQIIGATPWKQQLMIGLGVIIAALVAEPILELLFQAYGMGNVFPKSNMDPTQMLPAPQAGLMTAVAQAILGHTTPWLEITIGCLLGLIGIMIDEYLKRRQQRLPILAIGLGIYLPPDITTPVIIGGIINFLVRRKKSISQNHFESGLLLACGMVAGSALMGVILSIPFVIAGNTNILNILPNKYINYSYVFGVISTFYLCVRLYKTSISDQN